MKKVLALLLVLTTTVAMLAGCGSSTSTTTDGEDADPIVVTVWTMYAESEEETATSTRYQKLVDDFNASHTDIQIELVQGKTYDNIVTAIAGSDTPDIFQMYWQYAATLSEQGAIVDLTDYINNDESYDLDDFIDGIWDLCSVGESIYSVPISASTTYILYNPTLLAEAGWTEFPTTMDDLLQCALDCTKLNDDGTIEQVGLLTTFPWLDNVLWAAAFGVEYQDADGNVTADSDELRAVLTFQSTLIDALGGYEQATAWGTDYYSTRCTTSDPVLTGLAAMRYNADSGLAGFQESADELGLEYGVDYAIATLPTSMLTTGVFEMNAKTENQEAAWTVMSYLTSADAQKYLAEGGYNKGSFMPRISALNYLASMDVTDTVKTGCELLQQGTLYSFPMSCFVNEYLTALSTYTTEYLAGTMDLETAIANIQAEAEEAKLSYE